MSSSTLLIIGAGVVLVLVALVVFRGSFANPPALPSYAPARTLSRAEEDEVRDLLSQDQKIAAIKRMRELTGVGLKEAKEYVESLAVPVGSRTPARSSHDQFRSAAEPSPELERETRRILAESGKIPAIKYYREQTGLGLKAAKDYVDELERWRS